MAYIGRFAPTPSGPLHLGSLTAALASFLDARQHQGKWLVRIEDIDPPRIKPGATQAILKCLERHGLFWDEAIRYQSQYLSQYQDVIEEWLTRNQAYPCRCSRTELQDFEIYPGFCKMQPPAESEDVAIRLITPDDPVSFEDLIQGGQQSLLSRETGDFVVKRKDGLIAYQLAVAFDDAEQNISRVIRGADLLDSTFKQIFILDLLQKPTPEYGHIPVLVEPDGEKLSKQNSAQALNNATAESNLYIALGLLGQSPPDALNKSNIDEILGWGVENWNLELVPKLPKIVQ